MRRVRRESAGASPRTRFWTAPLPQNQTVSERVVLGYRLPSSFDYTSANTLATQPATHTKRALHLSDRYTAALQALRRSDMSEI